MLGFVQDAVILEYVLRILEFVFFITESLIINNSVNKQLRSGGAAQLSGLGIISKHCSRSVGSKYCISTIEFI